MSYSDSSAIAAELIDIHGGIDCLSRALAQTIRIVSRDVLRGAESFDDVEACQKSIFGTFFEKDFIRLSGLPSKVSKKKNPHKLPLDTRIAGFDIDVKTSMSGSWMIPRECVGEWCLLLRVDWRNQQASLGVLKADAVHLTEGTNQDRKHSISAYGIRNIDWIVQGVSYA